MRAGSTADSGAGSVPDPRSPLSWYSVQRPPGRLVAFAVTAAVLLPAAACSADEVTPAASCRAGDYSVGPLAGAQQPSVAPDVKRVAVIGDSYTSGAGAKPWPGLVWQRLAAEGIKIDSHVAGEGGSGYVTPGKKGTTFTQRVASTVAPDDQLVVFFGTRNDRGTDPAVLASAVHEALQQTMQRAPRARLLVIGPVWPTAPAPPEIEKVRDVVCEQARRSGATFVDPLDQGWLAGRPDLIQADGVHPNDAGQQVLADKISSVIKDQLAGPV